MNSVGKIVRQNALQLEYFVFGQGDETIICFHGHGRSTFDFEFLAQENRRVISIHLFFHGNSLFPINRIEKEPLKTNEFIELFKLILSKEKVIQFHLLAFSQGGRFTLCLTPFFGQQIESLTLIAPDGMDNYSFYNWSSRQGLARKLFTYLEKKPHKVIRYSNLATKLKLMRPKVKTFVHEFASNPDTFRNASLTWRAFRLMLPDYDAISRTLKENDIPLLIIMGKFDQVIRPKQAYQFAEKLGIKECVVEIENGHNFFKKSAIPRFKDLLPYSS